MKLTSLMNLDLSKLNLPDGLSFRNRNIVINRPYAGYSNEDGNELVTSMTAVLGGVVRNINGTIPLDDGGNLFFSSEAVLFNADIGSEIGVEDVDGNYEVIVRDSRLKFSSLNPIEGVQGRNSTNERIIVWCDGIKNTSNDVRILNIDNPIMDIDPITKAVINARDLILFNLFPLINVPTFNLIDVLQTGGSIPTGVYYFALQYELDDFSRTNWIGISGPISVALGSGFVISDYQGAEPNTLSNRVIRFSYGNLSPEYNKIRIAIIPKIGGEFTPKVILEANYNGANTFNFAYTGTEFIEDLILDNILVPNVVYNKVDTMTITEDRLGMAKITTTSVKDYQKYANNIKIEWVAEYKINPNTGYNNVVKEDFAFKYRGYRSDEVYAFYIHFNLKNGSKSAAFHIPGRPPDIGETDFNNSTKVVETVGGNNLAKNFHFINSAKLDGTMAYWENENEQYLNTEDSEIWDSSGKIGDLGNQNVRHHKFPDTYQLYTWGIPVAKFTTDLFALSLGIQVQNIYIPDEILDIIDSYEISYGKRTLGNSTIIGSSPTRAQNKHNLPDILWRTTPFEIMKYSLNPIITHVKEQYFSPDLFPETFEPTSITQWPGGGDILRNPTLPTTNPLYTHPNYFKSRDYWQPVKNSKILVANSNIKYDNRNREATFILEFNQDVNFETQNIYTPTTYTKFITETAILTLHTHKLNIYNPFTTQELVSTNSVYTVNNTTNHYQIGLLYGGDTWIVNYGLKDTSTNGASIRYGIQHVLIESTSNLTLRHNNPLADPPEFFYPNTLQITTATTNHFSYNDDYSNLADLIQVFPFNSIISQQQIDRLPHRIARSPVHSRESLEFKWRNFAASEYYEMPKDSGEIVAIRARNREMYIQTENALYRASIKDKLGVTGDTTFVGDADLFDRLPDNLLPTTDAILGATSKFGCIVCKLGYVWINAKNGKIFIYNQNGINEISNIGLNNYLRDNLTTWSNTAKLVNKDNPYIGYGLTLAFDEFNNRLMVSKIDKDGNSFTISYSPSIGSEKGGWISFHDIYPSFLYTKYNKLYSVRNSFNVLGDPDKTGTFKHDAVNNKGVFYGKKYQSYIDIIFNTKVNTRKVFQSLQWSSNVKEPLSEKIIYNNTFTDILVYNDYRSSGIVTLNGNVRHTEEQWSFNNFRDVVVNSSDTIIDDEGNLNESNIDINKAWFNQGKFIGKFLVTRFIYDNEDNKDCALLEVGMTIIKSTR